MNIEEEKKSKEKAGCKDFGSASKGFQEMFQKMRKRCTGQNGSIDCCDVMDEMMKEMMERFCAAKADDSKLDH